MTKERGIIFQAESVRGIMSGEKTQTRRIVKLGDHARPWFHRMDGDVAIFGDSIPDDPVPLEVRSPYGQKGDRLYVREALTQQWRLGPDHGAWLYKADGAAIQLDAKDPRVPHMLAWAHHKEGSYCNPLHMPRFASRLQLELLDIRIERLQDITEDDAKAEGVYLATLRGLGDKPIIGENHGRSKDTHPYTLAYACLWDTINKDRISWRLNPWVWRLQFRLLTAEEARGAA